MMRDALRLTLVCLLSLIWPWACSFDTSIVPDDLMIATWSAAPEAGTVADGSNVATLSLQLQDPNLTPLVGITVCLATQDSRVQLLAPPNAAAQLSVDANCALQTVTDAQGMLTADVSMLADVGDTSALTASIAGYVMRSGRPIALWTPATIAFVPPVAKAGLRITASDKTVTAGARFSYTVGMYDGLGTLKQDYRGQVRFDTNDTQATLPSAYTFTAADQGSKTFQGSFGSIGTQFLQVTDVAQPTLSSKALFSVGSGAYSNLAISLSPNVVVAGQAATLTLTAQDSLGNTVSSIDTTVSLQVVLDGSTTLTMSQLFTRGSAAISLNTTGDTLALTLANTTHTLQVTDLDNNISGELDDIEVAPAQAASVALNVSQNGNTYAQMPASLTLYDAYQNVATNYVGTVLLTSTDPQAVFTVATNGNTQLAYVPNLVTTMQTSTYTFNANDKGSHTFGVTLKSVIPPPSANTSAIITSTQSITITDAAHADLSASANITVSASQNFYVLALSTDQTSTAATLTAGTSYYVHVAEYNPYNVQVSDPSASLNLQTDDANAVITVNPVVVTTIPNYTSAPVLAFQTAGTRTLVAIDGPSGRSGALSIAVLPGNANTILLGGIAQSSQAGFVQSPNMTIKDAYGNIATNYRGSIHFSSNDNQAVLASPYTFAAADAGMHTFASGLQWRTAQSNTSLTASDNTISTTLNNLLVTPADANRLSVTVAPSSTCTPMAANIVVQDAYANTVTSAANSNATLSFKNPNTNALVPLVSPSSDAGVLRAPTIAGVASIAPFQLAKSGSYVVNATWQNLTSSAQTLVVAASTPGISFVDSTSAGSAAQAINYKVQNVCSAQVAFSYVPAGSTNQNFLLTQAAIATSQGTDLHGLGPGSAARVFMWDSPNDVGYAQAAGNLRALLINADTGATVAQSNSLLPLNSSNQPSFVSTQATPTSSGTATVATLYDLDQDGLLDVVFGAGGTLGVAYGTSSGQMTLSSLTADNADSNSKVVQISVADLDHDGAADIVVCWNNDAANTGHLSVYTTGAASNAAPTRSANIALYCRGLVLTDFNNDGYTDVVTATADTNTLSFVKYTSAGLSLGSSTPLNLAKPANVLAADILHHGVLDYVVTSAAAGSMMLIAGNPNYGNVYTSGQPTPIAVRTPVQQAALADVNRDGYVDIVTMGSASNSNIYVYLGDQNNYTAPGRVTLSTTPVQTTPFALGDFNGDGAIDMVTSAAGTGAVTWYLGGDGNGQFIASNTIPLVVPLATGDLDHSGSIDIWGTTQGGYVSQLNANVHSVNAAPHGTWVVDPQLTANSSYVAAGDVNNDGFADIVLVGNLSAGGYTLRQLLGDSTGHFSASDITPAGADSALYAGIPVIVDFNLDGYNDIVVPEETSSGSAVRFALGQNVQASPVFASIATASSYLTHQLVVADLDADGWQDIALTTASTSATNNGQGGLTLLLSGQTPAPFPPTGQIRQTLNQNGTIGVAASNPNDLTGSSAAVNLLVWGSTSAQSYYLGNRGGGNFTPVVINSVGRVTSAVYADTDGDNIADIAYTTASNPNGFLLSRGQGAGAFQTPVQVSVSTCQPTNIVRLLPSQLSAPSFAVSCAQSARTRAVYSVNTTTGVVQNGSATYTSLPNSGGASAMLVTADINGDGRKDLLSLEPNALGNQNPGLTVVLAGNTTNGAGSFLFNRASVSSDTRVYSSQVQLADIDGDGALDAVVVNANTNTVSVYPSNRDGSFGALKQSITVPGASAIEVGDFNRNGMPDVLVRGTAGISVLTNSKGNLSLSTSAAYAALSTELSCMQMALRDVNHDGFLDVTTLRQNGSIAVYVWLTSGSTGTLSNAVSTQLPAEAGATGFVYGDIDHSGDDALVTSGAAVYVLTRDGSNYDYNVSALSNVAGARAVGLADLDHDGSLDLVYVTNDGALLCGLVGNADGSFARTTRASCANLPAPSNVAPILRLADVDQDGFVDAVLAWPSTGLAAWVMGEADVTWASPQLYAVGNSISNMAVGDVNNDSRPDVVFARTDGMWPQMSNATNPTTDSVVSILGH